MILIKLLAGHQPKPFPSQRGLQTARRAPRRRASVRFLAKGLNHHANMFGPVRTRACHPH
ncbi:hypothetical protein K3756_14155 [Sulfitobacter sp. S190]|nr:hypothetical protein K3756_14155 [Sulfitobacter sp. S190]